MASQWMMSGLDIVCDGQNKDDGKRASRQFNRERISNGWLGRLKSFLYYFLKRKLGICACFGDCVSALNFFWNAIKNS